MNEAEEVLNELKKLWAEGRPFYMQMEVGRPYDGCFYEPNIFLVTPVGCELQEELMGGIPTRYAPDREFAQRMYNEAYTNMVTARYRFDRTFAESKEPEAVAYAFDVLTEFESIALDLEVEYELRCAEHPDPLPQPNIVVWPLYASGQGMGMDAVHSLEELLQVCSEESVFDLACRDTYPDGLEGTRLVTEMLGSTCHGRITLVAVSPLYGEHEHDGCLPLNEALPAGERYWMHALKVASEQWDVDLTWRCEECGEIIEYDEYEGRPEPTGYHGDGGIGIHYTDVMCGDCARAGMCDACQDEGYSPMEAYDSDVKQYGWTLCEYHAEQLLKDCGLAGDVEFDTETIELRWWKDPKQTEFPHIPLDPVLRFLIDGKLVEGLEYDSPSIALNAERMGVEHLHPEYGCGVYFSAKTVENIAYRGRNGR